jgi:hypothetical protein
MGQFRAAGIGDTLLPVSRPDCGGRPPQEWLEINDWLFELQSRHPLARIEGFLIFSCARR